jgi:hypothetical protein
MPRARPQRARIFVAFEGYSESAFCAWLHDLCDEKCLNVHLDRPGRMTGGDPLSLVKCALEHRDRSKKKAGVGHRSSLLMIDADRLDDGSLRSREAIELADRERLILIRQRPCFEALLLRLHRGHEQAFPNQSREVTRQLQRVWPKYEKPPTRMQLASRFRLDDLERVAGTDVEVRRLLEVIGLTQRWQA